MSLVKIDSNKLSNAISKRGINQRVLANLAGVSEGVISKMVTRGTTSRRSLFKVAKALRKPLEYFFYSGDEGSQEERVYNRGKSVNINSAKIEEQLYVKNMNNSEFCNKAKIDASNFSKILRRGTCMSYIARRIASALSMPFDELILTNASSPTEGNMIEKLAMEIEQFTLANEVTQEVYENEKYEKPKWQVLDELFEKRRQPFQRILQITADVISDAKHIAEAYGVEISDVIRAVDLSSTLFAMEGYEVSSND